MTTMREKIGDAIAYGIGWHAKGITRVIHCGGTVDLTHKSGKRYKITVEEVDDEHRQEVPVLLSGGREGGGA